MDNKFSIVTLLVLVAYAAAQFENYGGYDGYKSPVYLHHQQNLDDGHENHGDEYELDYHAHPKYSFDYSVKDPHTGDEKEHWETRDGDKVKGSYTLIETDGTKRVVEYEADDKNGFNAVVHKIGTPKHEEYEPKYEKFEANRHQNLYIINMTSADSMKGLYRSRLDLNIRIFK